MATSYLTGARLRAVPTTLVALAADATVATPIRPSVSVADMDDAYRAELITDWLRAQGDQLAELAVMAAAIRFDRLTGGPSLVTELMAAIEGDMPEMAVAA
ncbi:hypothetical protein [Streptomyces sp. XC 2026]|uniref:hypothetical protein n=1 Tax=Streptomyces sp. XC 2026 TaxID=2782004 RepID=UPI001907D3DF|nr:hypothetical protein [Streptomyces sp. XC 2026]QQN79745.1 hypothetical protein IPZ77_21705 [Streptomyces sp. XC 2026]QQN80647.1 hypothetical protein IPZ77_26950 [Streptomyces sp. XC 2026]